MSRMKKESPLRSIVKGFSWRIIATCTTITVAYLVTGSIETGIKIGMWEFVLKLAIYYFHERAWQFAWKDGVISKKESLVKTISWRITASTTTGIISYLMIKFGSVEIGATSASSQALIIILFEASSKMVLYYFHERTWLKVPLGTFRNMIPFLKEKENTAPKSEEGPDNTELSNSTSTH
ncbi:MAG: DUF2061 domain-containing protein [Chitinophagales bacterium]|nr:DUF2061 domain-containing protein [Chitinophagales bacterium]